MARRGTFDSNLFCWVHVGVRAVACRGCFSLRIQPRRLFSLGRTPFHGYRTTSFQRPCCDSNVAPPPGRLGLPVAGQASSSDRYGFNDMSSVTRMLSSKKGLNQTCRPPVHEIFFRCSAIRYFHSASREARCHDLRTACACCFCSQSWPVYWTPACSSNYEQSDTDSCRGDLALRVFDRS